MKARLRSGGQAWVYVHRCPIYLDKSASGGAIISNWGESSISPDIGQQIQPLHGSALFALQCLENSANGIGGIGVVTVRLHRSRSKRCQTPKLSIALA